MANIILSTMASQFLPFAKKKLKEAQIEVAISKKDEENAQLQMFMNGEPTTAFNVPFDQKIEAHKLVEILTNLMKD